MKNFRLPDSDISTLMPLLINVWRKFRKEPGPADKLQTREFRSVVDAVTKLEAKNDLPENYLNNPDFLSGHLLYHWIVHYQQGLSILNELPFKPRRVLDVCSGAMPFAFAALKHEAQEVYALDQSSVALEMGASICGKYGFTVTGRKWDCLKQPCPISGHFDLIILGHCLEELFPTVEGWQEKQEKFLSLLLGKLSPQGFLVIVDNSRLETNKRILQIRDHFVVKGIPIQAPCVWKGECPALKTKNSPCYAQREFEKPYLIKEIQRAAEINLSSLKMSYIIFRNPLMDWPTLPSTSLHRVVSPPVETYHGKRYYLCGTDGKKTLGTTLSSHPAESRAFEYLRRGELISIENAFAQGPAIDILQETKIVVQAACGKPLI